MFFRQKMEISKFHKEAIVTSSQLRASREKNSEPVFEEKHKMHFEQKLKARKYKITFKNI